MNAGDSHRAASERGWEETNTELSAGTDDVLEAAWYLTTSRVWPLVTGGVRGPFVLGAVLALLIAAIVLLSPSTESRFIYTDF